MGVFTPRRVARAEARHRLCWGTRERGADNRHQCSGSREPESASRCVGTKAQQLEFVLEGIFKNRPTGLKKAATKGCNERQFQARNARGRIGMFFKRRRPKTLTHNSLGGVVAGSRHVGTVSLQGRVGAGNVTVAVRRSQRSRQENEPVARVEPRHGLSNSGSLSAVPSRARRPRERSAGVRGVPRRAGTWRHCLPLRQRGVIRHVTGASLPTTVQQRRALLSMMSANRHNRFRREQRSPGDAREPGSRRRL